MLTKRRRASPRSSARCLTRAVPTSSPMTALTTTSAPSTTRNAQRASPWKLGSPGTSMKLSFRPCQLVWASVNEIDIFRFCSSSSQSPTVEPTSIEPSRLISSVWYSSASTSDVLPVPRWPTTATLRIFPGSMAAMGVRSSSDVWVAASLEGWWRSGARHGLQLQARVRSIEPSCVVARTRHRATRSAPAWCPAAGPAVCRDDRGSRSSSSSSRSSSYVRHSAT